MTDDAIAIEMIYPHPVDRVWRALTTREALATWLMPNDFAPEVGRRFTFRVEAQHGWSGVVECQVTALDPPHRLAYTWRSGELPTTLVTFTLDPMRDGTRLRLVHSGFAAGGPAALSIRDILASGWNSKLLRKRLPALLGHMAVQEKAATPATEG